MILASLVPIIGKSIGKLLLPVAANVVAAQISKKDPEDKAAWVKARGVELVKAMVAEGDLPSAEDQKIEDYLAKIVSGIVALFKLIGVFAKNSQSKA